MDFLVKVAPFVDWKQKTVTCYVGTKKYILPTCSIGSIGNISDDNSFAGLQVDVTDDSAAHAPSHDTNINKISNHVASE